MCLHTEIALLPRENIEFENRLQVNFVQKELIPHENDTPAFH